MAAAVDPQHLARDERAERTCEHLDETADLINGCDAIKRAAFDKPLLIDRACP